MSVKATKTIYVQNLLIVISIIIPFKNKPTETTRNTAYFCSKYYVPERMYFSHKLFGLSFRFRIESVGKCISSSLKPLLVKCFQSLPMHTGRAATVLQPSSQRLRASFRDALWELRRCSVSSIWVSVQIHVAPFEKEACRRRCREGSKWGGNMMKN